MGSGAEMRDGPSPSSSTKRFRGGAVFPSDIFDNGRRVKINKL